jgi:hypothetical protein
MWFYIKKDQIYVVPLWVTQLGHSSWCFHSRVLGTLIDSSKCHASYGHPVVPCRISGVLVPEMRTEYLGVQIMFTMCGGHLLRRGELPQILVFFCPPSYLSFHIPPQLHLLPHHCWSWYLFFFLCGTRF